MQYIAHTKNQQGNRHDLVEHLRTVADLAAGFASSFNAAELARYVGLWHDVGKFNPTFQEYLLRAEVDPSAKGTGPDHKAAGSQIALKHLPPLALLVQGHHGGLHSPSEMQAWLQRKLASSLASFQAIETALSVLPELEPAGKLTAPPFVEQDRSAAELFLRLLFSALVDADCLDTERHFQQDKASLRGSTVTLEELWARLEAAQQSISGKRHDTVSQVRHEIYEACLAAAELPPSIFRLTVPTGGGKTRSGMAFALRHALRHGQKRVIVAVPFITITEQTAQTYTSIFEPHADDGNEDSQPVVLEHHSGGDYKEDEEGDFRPSNMWKRLASENWDAPIIVTTTVQLFESLFASRTSPCRKLHRLANCVIILDEAQALPPHLLHPILDALQQLCAYYGTTVVLSTATQPAFDTIPDFRTIQATEIVPDPARYFDILKRVEYEWRADRPLAWDEIADIARSEPRCLAVVNTKQNAMSLLDALDDPEALHLSTLLCGAHRRNVIAEVKRRLASGESCHLVATQVIEAGVDLDFPMVLRALGPLDGIIQAAGRCNREGRLEKGRVIVFLPEEGGMPPGAYRTGADITRALVGKGDLDPDDPRESRTYFERLFGLLNIDRESIQKLRASLDYPQVAQRFKMIDDDTESVVVNYGTREERRNIERLLAAMKAGMPPTRSTMRRLQPFTVSIRRGQADKNRDMIDPVVPGLGIWTDNYDSVRGLVSRLNPDSLVV
ncbi:MAG: CRISPR-associated endonuclease Cas3'' [Chloroflexota bacterium]|nr:CRISPR-associated endonuclease Cas3'' [Chloroflexota bacterium]